MSEASDWVSALNVKSYESTLRGFSEQRAFHFLLLDNGDVGLYHRISYANGPGWVGSRNGGPIILARGSERISQIMPDPFADSPQPGNKQRILRG